MGLLFDYFLFCKDSIRIAPPLVMTDDEAMEMCRLITETLEMASA
jgi:4-aminobutyrate aminotransferase-like enzyme